MGHVAIAYLCLVAFDRIRAAEEADGMAVLIVVFGALFPDLVDKPLSWYLGILPTGRSLAHSLVILVPLCLVVWYLAKQQDRELWGVAFAIGAISHALVDALPVLWREDASAAFLLYPLVTVAPYEENGAPTVWGLFLDSWGEPYFMLEFVLLGIALVVWQREGYPGITPIRRAIAGMTDFL